MFRGTALLTPQSENKTLLTSTENLNVGSWPERAWKGKQPTVCGGRCPGHDHMKQRITFNVHPSPFATLGSGVGGQDVACSPLHLAAQPASQSLLMQDHAY